MNKLNEVALRSKLTVVLDENLLALKAALEDTGFRVAVYRQGLKDFELMPLLSGKAILTKNSKDFLIDAVIHDFDVIAIEAIKFIDDKKDRSNETVKKIAGAIRSSKFYTLRGNYLLTVKDDGSWGLEELH